MFNILLQILDDGRVTDSQGRVVNFKNAIIILTSNMGSDIILSSDNNEETRDKVMSLVSNLSPSTPSQYSPLRSIPLRSTWLFVQAQIRTYDAPITVRISTFVIPSTLIMSCV